MPLVSGGGSGGASAPLTLTAPDANTVPLTLKFAANPNADAIDFLNSAGQVMGSIDNAVDLNVGQIVCSVTFDAYALRVIGGGGATTHIAEFGPQLGPTSVSMILASGALATALTSAPADAELAAGELSLWFDKTNGASKLMIKAKQADGAVKAAAIALA